jgi:hypothetical protein
MSDYILSQVDGVITDEVDMIKDSHTESFAKISKNGFKYLYIFGLKVFF